MCLFSFNLEQFLFYDRHIEGVLAPFLPVLVAELLLYEKYAIVSFVTFLKILKSHVVQNSVKHKFLLMISKTMYLITM